MPSSEIIPATLDHVQSMLGRIRPDDHRECLAISGKDADYGLLHGFKSSDMSWTFLKNGLPIAMFGRAKPSWLSFWAAPWLLGTVDLESVGRTAWKASRHYVHKMIDGVDLLENYVDDRNKISMNWIRWCGFDLDDQCVEVGAENYPFHRFEMRRK